MFNLIKMDLDDFFYSAVSVDHKTPTDHTEVFFGFPLNPRTIIIRKEENGELIFVYRGFPITIAKATNPGIERVIGHLGLRIEKNSEGAEQIVYRPFHSEGKKVAESLMRFYLAINDIEARWRGIE